MNFIEEFKSGQNGDNFGLPMGLDALEKSIDGLQRKTIYTIASAPKVGKSTFVDYAFLIQPYLYYVEHPELDIEWIYYSFEITRVRKEFKIAAFFISYDYEINMFEYKNKIYKMSPRYLLGKLKDDDGNFIPVNDEHKKLLKEVYYNRIIPMFGEFDSHGKMIKPGKIKFIGQKTNPTGIRNELLAYADKHGKFIKEKYKTKNDDGILVTKERISGYKPNNPKKITIIITDHVRSLNIERGFTIKQNIDKYSQYETDLRDWCGFTFVNIIHVNRGLSSVDRIIHHKEYLYPTSDDIKDSGNLSEDSDVIITLFNPRDEKYNLTKHFGLDLANYPNYRSIHVVESRDTLCPAHFRANMFGHNNTFEMIDL